jgi:hypothetical protein
MKTTSAFIPGAVAAVALGAFGAVAFAPREADAQVRASAFAGVERLGGGGRSSTMFMARAEGTFSLIPWLHLGAYGQLLSGFDGDNKSGWALGGLVALRPRLPGTSWDPMGYVSLGYQRTPVDNKFESGVGLDIGGGIAWRFLPLLDFEARGGFTQLFGSGDNMSGFHVALGLSLHP